GTHGTGKSTKTLALANKLKSARPEKDVRIIEIDGISRDCLLPINTETTQASQLWIWTAQLNREILSKADILVCSRSILDFLIYTKVAGFADIAEKMLPMTLCWLKTYDELIWLRPQDSLANDGIRDTDRKWQLKIDTEFEKFIKKYAIPVKCSLFINSLGMY
ncbi:MAG: AAA family ATPase, partial [candidate division Zixibacteria bacterium]|nr:AAA family ATPase [candidate division Zixibacteria bacterium]